MFECESRSSASDTSQQLLEKISELIVFLTYNVQQRRLPSGEIFWNSRAHLCEPFGGKTISLYVDDLGVSLCERKTVSI